MSFEGSCHCGSIQFTVDAPPPTEAISCNCSHCRRRGALLSFFPSDKVAVTQGQQDLHTYQFNTHKIDHQFCPNCGIEAFARGAKPDGSTMYAVNLRCVPSIDLGALELRMHDGANS